MPGCNQCGHLACVCIIEQLHKLGCTFRLAATCAVPIECQHGYDVCPTCDPCTCATVTTTAAPPEAKPDR